MANRAQENYKLIVGIEGSRSGEIPKHKQKDKIPGRRGIVYFNADGSTSSITGNPPSENEDGTKNDGTTQPDDGSGSSNGGNTTGDAGITDPYQIDDPTQNGSGIFSVDNLTLGDLVKGLTGLKDCATGNPVEVRFDGQFTAPDGWDDPSTPPIDPTYESGYSWSYSSLSNHPEYSTSSAAKAAGAAFAGDISAWNEWTSDWVLYESSGPGSTVGGRTWVQIDSYRRSYINPAYPEYVNYKSYVIYKMECPGLGFSACNPSPDDILLTEWPFDKPMQLSYNAETGKYETNPYDSNVTTAYAQPVNSFSLCNENGDTIKSYAQANGGQALMNETTGIATFIDSNGKVTGYGDGAAVTNGQPR